MRPRNKVTLDPEIQRQARRRASDLMARDLGSSQPSSSPTAVFDLAASGGSDIARDKHSMLAEAFASHRRKPRRR